MSFKLPGSARTIMKSRLRHHPRREQVIGTDPALITNATTADMGQWALLLGLDAPTEKEAAVYDAVKAEGATAKEAVNRTNRWAHDNGRGGPGLTEIMGGAAAASADAPAAADAPAVQPEAPKPEAPKADTDPQKAKAAAEVKETLALFGGGDMDGFNARLHDMALRANRPDPVIAPAMLVAPRQFDPAKVAGHVPQVIATKTMQAAGIEAPQIVDMGATAFDVYDAPDAPAVQPGYIWPAHTGNALAALAHGQNVMLTGPAGTGKTTFAKQLAARYGRPFVRISCNDQTDAPTLVGQPGLDNGSTHWEDGQLVKAIRRPGTVILIDEPSAARPGAMMILQGVLDDDRAIQIADTGEVVHVAPGVVFILADNTAGYGDENGLYEGTRVMNKATLDRMALTVPVGYLPADQEAKAIASATGLDKARANKLAKFAALTRQKSKNGDLSHGLGIRRLMALAVQIKCGADPATAYQMAVINAAPYDDREPLRQLWAAEVNANTFRK